MKKIFFILIAIVLVSVVAVSCKKQCVCYELNGNIRAGYGSLIATEEECIRETTPLIDSIYLRCEWERW